jgi:hypothetical protein
MLTSKRFITATALVGALAVAGPVTGASAAQAAPAVASATTAGSSIPCYPFPAFCASNGQPAWWAPTWVWPALGLTPPHPLPRIVIGTPVSLVG